MDGQLKAVFRKQLQHQARLFEWRVHNGRPSFNIEALRIECVAAEDSIFVDVIRRAARSARRVMLRTMKRPPGPVPIETRLASESLGLMVATSKAGLGWATAVRAARFQCFIVWPFAPLRWPRLRESVVTVTGGAPGAAGRMP
jgi:hypothetical protein